MDATSRADAPRPRVAKTFAGVSPVDYLLARTRPLVEESRVPTRALHKTAFLASLIFEGKHRFAYSAERDWYYANPGENEPTRLYHADNYYRFLIKSNVKEYLKSQPSIRARAASIENDAADAAARIANAVKRDFERRKRPTAQRRVEYGRVQLAGNFAVHIDFNRAGGDRVSVPQYARETFKPAPDSFTCHGCGGEAWGDLAAAGIAADPMGGPAACPACGSTATETIVVPEVPRTVLAGTLEVPTGDWIVRSVSALELTVNASARDHADLSDVLWLRWQYLEPRAVAEANYEGVELPGADALAGSDEDRGLRYQRYLAAAIGGTESPDWIPLSPWADQVICIQDWFAPAAYAEYVVAEGDTWSLTVDGQKITMQAGDRLTDVLRYGAQFIHYGRTPVALNSKGTAKKTAIQRHWNFYGFDPKAESFWYAGTEDAIPLQLELNEVRSFIKTFVKTASMPLTAVRTEYVEDFGLASNPSKIVAITQEAPEGSIDQIIKTFPPGSPGQSVYEYLNSLKESMQYATGALNNFNGADSSHTRTATQTSILQASALAHAEAVIDGLQESEARLYELAVELWREGSGAKRAFEVESDYGDTEQQEFAGADLDVDVEFVVEPGTSLPRRPYQERDDYEGFVKQKIDLVTAGIPVDEDLEAFAANVYGLSSAMVKGKRAERRTAAEIAALTQIAAQAAGIVGEMAAAKQAQIAAMPDDEPEPPAEARAEGPAAEAAEPRPNPKMLKAQATVALAAQLQSPDGQAALILEWIAQNPTAPAAAKVCVPADDHQGHITFLRRYLNGDRGLKADVLTRALLAARISERWQALGAQKAEETAAQVAAQMPAAQVQMMQQAAAAEQQTAGSVAVERERAAQRSSDDERPASGAGRDGASAKRGATGGQPRPRKARTEDS